MPSVADLTKATDPMSFFRSNIVMISYSAAQRNVGQVWPMWMADGWVRGPGIVNAWTGLKPKAGAIPVVTVMNFGGPVGKTFDAYWCPYEANALQQVTLSNKANFMFTAKMDGCTFGVGSVTPSKERLVCHVNLGARGAFGDQGKSQVDLATGPSGPLHGDKSASYLGPAAYRFIDPNANEETQATTFGVRRSNGLWEIWTQVCLFKRSAKVIELVEVRQIA